jgi:tRNA (cmo5U34)-methyltransferase
MGHSVRRHLHLDIREYDEAIRRFIPGYDEMLAVLAERALADSPTRVLDLGSGTGAVAAELLARSRTVQVQLLDADPEMLALARDRLARHGTRARFRVGSFADRLPGADVVTASLALHHIASLHEKEAVFHRIAAALPQGGVFLNADATLPSPEPDRTEAFRGWASHLVARGIPEERAWRHFEEWSEEDTYFSVEEELAAMARAGLKSKRIWSRRVMSVVVGRKG